MLEDQGDCMNGDQEHDWVSYRPYWAVDPNFGHSQGFTLGYCRSSLREESRSLTI